MYRMISVSTNLATDRVLLMADRLLQSGFLMSANGFIADGNC